MTAKKAVILFCLLFTFLILASGCETTKGVACSVGNIAEGAAKDTKGLWQAILKADKWIKENLW